MTDLKQQIKDNCLLRLGSPQIDIELSPEQLELCLQRAFQILKQRSSSGVEEGYHFLETQKGVQEYILPNEIEDVREIFKRSFSRHSSGYESDPMNLYFTNFFLGDVGRAGTGGGLVSYELYHNYLKTAGKMFGMYVNYHFQPATKKLFINYNPMGREHLLIWCYKYLPDEVILSDIYKRPWIEDWCLAEAKEMIGQARSKFPSFASVGGAASLNGSEMKSEAEAMKTRLLQELDDYGTGDLPTFWIQG